MSKIKRMICTLLAMCMVLTFSACKKEADVGDVTSSESKKEADAGDVTSSESKKEADTGDVTLKWYIPLNKQTDLELVNEEVNKITTEKLGIKIDMVIIDNAAYTERMNMNMAASDDYDICWIGYLNTFVNAVSKGGLMKIDEFLEKAPALKEAIPEYLWGQSKYKGDTYIVPNVQTGVDRSALYFRQDLIEKYNFDITKITKTEDVEPFLQIILENEPDVIPFCVGSGVASLRSLDEEMKLTGEPLVVAVKDETTGKFTAMDGLEVADTYSRAKKLNEWYEKGYIRKDVATHTDDATDMRAGKYACWVSSWKPGGVIENETKYGYDIECTFVSPAFRSPNSASGSALAIGKDSKHPQEAIKFIELLHTDKELYNLICYGIEGMHYNKIEENRIELIKDSGYSPNANWKFGTVFNAYLLPGQEDDVWEQTKIANETAKTNGLESFLFDNSQVKNIITNLNNVVQEYKVVRQGWRNPDEYWAEFKQKLYDNGFQKYIDEYQRQLDEYLKEQ